MNLFESLYASLYDARIKGNQPAGDSPLSANIVMSLCLIVFVGSVIIMLGLIFPGFGDGAEDLLKDIFGRRLGRSVGKLLVILGLLIFYPIVRFTIGTPARYKKIKTDFTGLPETEQQQVARKGTWFLGVTLGSFVLPLLVWLIKSMF